MSQEQEMELQLRRLKADNWWNAVHGIGIIIATIAVGWALLAVVTATFASADDLTVTDRFGAPVEALTEGPDGAYVRRGPAGEYLGSVGPDPGGGAVIRDRFGRYQGAVAPDGTIRDEFGRRSGSVAPDGAVRGSPGQYKGSIRRR